MKNTLRSNFYLLIQVPMIFLGLLYISPVSRAQEQSPLRLYLDIMCYQKPSEIELQATVRARIGENRKILPVSDLPVNFLNFTDSSELLLGTVSTNADGIAGLVLPEGTELLYEVEEGYHFKVEFEGSEKFRKGSKDISVRKAGIDISFDEIDSVKVITASAYETDPFGSERKSINGEDLIFYVPGSFSLYRIGEGELVDGRCSVNFPVTLPGDTRGNLTIITRIEESDEYGFVEASSVKDWGTVRIPVVPEERRGLGDTDAPLWMVYTLIVLLSAVWVHYVYVFVVIYLIKKDTKTVS